MTASPCIDDDTIARIVAHSLDERERGAAIAHLETCDDCRSLVADAMQLADETRTLGGRYRLEGELGRGGMGMVFRARDDVLDRLVAIKLLPGASRPDDRARARLVRESKAMAKLRHRNIVAVHDAGEDGEEFWVAMEYIPGPTLRGWLAKHDASQQRILALFVKAARGLAAAHAVGVIHRDFKPDNVLLDGDGEPKVADFGLARSETEIDDGDGPGLGTPAYMPPEQIGSGDIDGRADVFSVCVSLWEALFGVRPFVESSTEARMTAIERGDFVIPATHDIDSRLRKVLERGLAFDRERRFPSMDALVAELDGFVDVDGRRRRWLAPVLASAGIVAVGTTAVLALRPESCPPPDDRLAAAWSAETIPQIQGAVFERYDATEAQMTWSRLRPAIDGVAAAFDQELVLTCEARASGAITDALASRRNECLRLERTALAYRLELAAHGDIDAARGIDLGNPATWCRDLAETWVERPRSAARADEIAASETGLAEAVALMQLGRNDAARQRAEATAAAADALGDPVLAARARLEQGKVEPDPSVATATLDRAAREAADVGEHSTSAMAWIFAGYYAGDPRWSLEHGRAELDRIDNPVVHRYVEMRAAVLEGEILIDEGDAEEAQVHFDRALALARDHAPALVPDILFVSTVAAWVRGEIALALTRQADLVRWHDAAYSPNRQAHARALWNLADLHLEAGDYDASLQAIRRAHDVRGVGDDADDDARQLLSEAEVLLRRGELELAEAALGRAAAMPNVGPDLAMLAALRGMLLLLRGEPARAAEELRPQLERLSPTVDFGMDAADGHAVFSEAMRRAGRAEEALPIVELMLERLHDTHPRLPETGRVAIACGWLLHDLGRHAEATARFDEALALPLDPDSRAWAEVGRFASVRSSGGVVVPDILVGARAVLQTRAGAHRFELATIDELSNH